MGVKYIFQFKRMTALEWATSNPILNPGEPGLESDTGFMKIGLPGLDGIGRNWNDVPYQNGLGVTGDLANLTDVTLTSVATNDLIQYSAGKWINRSLSAAGIAPLVHNHDADYYKKDEVTDLLDEAATDTTEAIAVVSAQIAAAVPAGVISQFAGASAPTGYLLCTGQSLSTTTYAALFAVIGYTYGGSGSSFNLPNLQGRIPIGAGTVTDVNTRSAAFTRGATGGEIDHRLVTANMPSHSHGGSTGGNWAYNSYDIHTAGGGSTFHPVTWATTFVGGDGTYRDKTYHSHSITAEGGGGYHNNIQPYLVVNYIIKT